MSDQDDKVLTDDEKNALLEGVESGAVEVQSGDGSRYANVTPYVIGPRARLTSNSLPRLDALNGQFATRMGKAASELLQTDVRITAGPVRVQAFADFRDLWPARSVAVTFQAPPLPGEAVLTLESVVVGPLVEAFFGGNSPEATAHNGAAHSAGALSTVQLFVAEALAVLADVWKPLAELKPRRVATQVGLDLVESVGDGDAVIACEFELALGADGKERGAFCLLWPEASVAGIRAGLEGKRRDRDAAVDRRWAEVIRASLPDVVVPLTTSVGRARLTLGDVVNLKPGDVIGIDTPRVATLSACGVPLLEGRFGVQAGRNAIETVCWLNPRSGR